MENQVIVISLTIEEANALRQLMDAGVRQGGLQIAPTAAVLDKKLMEAFEESKKVNIESDVVDFKNKER